MWLRMGKFATGFEAFGDDLVGGPAVEHALAAGVVGGIEAAQQPLEVAVGVDGDAQHLAANAAVEALGQAVNRHDDLGALMPC
jgi:hypothetical protein